VTPSVSSKSPSLATDAFKRLAASTTDGCTGGCTGGGKTEQADPLAALAAALLGLSPADRARLAAMLLAPPSGRAGGEAADPLPNEA
jgi:hypothetical protein